MGKTYDAYEGSRGFYVTRNGGSMEAAEVEAEKLNLLEAILGELVAARSTGPTMADMLRRKIQGLDFAIIGSRAAMAAGRKMNGMETHEASIAAWQAERGYLAAELAKVS
jgi:hypothetical protein